MDIIRDLLEGTYAYFSLGYLSYFIRFLYFLIPMSIQIILSYFIEKKQIHKVIIMILLTQGIVLCVAMSTHEIIYYIYKYANSLGFLSIITNKLFAISCSVVYTSILIIIGFFTYRSIDKNITLKKLIILLSLYLLNIFITIFYTFAIPHFTLFGMPN